MTTAEIMNEIRQRAMLLPEADRRLIALEILNGVVDGDGAWEPSDAAVAALDRRCDAIDAGEEKLVSLQETDAIVRARFGW